MLLYYVACPLVVNGKRCKAKATRVDGIWRCKSCEYSFLEPSEYGLSVRIQIQDHTGTTSATVCEEAAEDIFGCRGRDGSSINYIEKSFAQRQDILLGALCKQYVFQLRFCLDVVVFTSIHVCWCVLGWNLVQFLLQSTSTHVDCGEYDYIQTRPEGRRAVAPACILKSGHTGVHCSQGREGDSQVKLLLWYYSSSLSAVVSGDKPWSRGSG